MSAAVAAGASAGARCATGSSTASRPSRTPGRRSRAARRPASGCRTRRRSRPPARGSRPAGPVTSKPASASQAQAYEASSVPARWSSSAPATPGSRSANPGPNQVCAAVGTTALVPSARTSAARSCQLSGVPIRAPVQSRRGAGDPVVEQQLQRRPRRRSSRPRSRTAGPPASAQHALRPGRRPRTGRSPAPTRRARAGPSRPPRSRSASSAAHRAHSVAAEVPSAGPTSSSGPRPPERRAGERGDRAHGRDSRNTVSPAPCSTDVEGVPARLRGGDQRAPPLRRQARQQRVGGQRGLAVRQVDPGPQPVEQPAGEHGQREERGRPRPARPRPQRAERPVPGVVGGCPAPPGEGPAVPVQRAGLLHDRAVRTGLPELEQRVGHRVSGAVQHPAVQPDRAGGARRHQLRAAGVRQREPEERPDGLTRGAGRRIGHDSVQVRSRSGQHDVPPVAGGPLRPGDAVVVAWPAAAAARPCPGRTGRSGRAGAAGRPGSTSGSPPAR